MSKTDAFDPIDLKLPSYAYDLPESLIAQQPLEKRGDSRLLVYDHEKSDLTHPPKPENSHFSLLRDYLPARSNLVFNRSKVFPCRLLGHKLTGGEAELFILKTTPTNHLYPALIKASGKRKKGEEFRVANCFFKLVDIGDEGVFWVSVSGADQPFREFLENKGLTPLPPYIKRAGVENKSNDITRYQTVYAKEEGSVAAPTAGLHFTEAFLKQLLVDGHEMIEVTLHVGLGTFRPVKTEMIIDHQMHAESFFIDSENQKKLQNLKSKPIAIGTTSLRVLETLWSEEGKSWSFSDSICETSIFLHPGKKVYSISGLITNFHLPQSSLLMLVSSLIGRERVLTLYGEAIKEQYRFFSYGDAMFIKGLNP